jgi:hypothetical protein
MTHLLPLCRTARVVWVNDPRHHGTVLSTWPDNTASVEWSNGWISERVPVEQLRRLTLDEERE